MKNTILVRCATLFTLLLTLMPVGAARAQCASTWSGGIGTPGANSLINAIAVLPGGDVIAGGFFNSIGGVSASRIARYSPSTNTWSALAGGGVSGTGVNVAALITLPGGDVLVAGTFTSAGGLAVNGLARYNPSTNVWTNPGNVTGSISSFALLPSGDVVVGGNFNIIGTVVASNVARYNPNTNVWTALSSGVSGPVTAVVGLPNGDVIAGGTFTNAGTATVSNLARYSFNTFTWSNVANGTNGAVNALTLLPSGDLMVGGAFTTAGSVSASRIARLNLTTNVWSNLGTGTSSTVLAVAVLPSGDLIVAGQFGNAAGLSGSTGVARYNVNLNTWSSLAGGAGGGVSALGLLPGGDVIVGGNFTTVGSVSATNIARLQPGASAPTIFGQPLPQVAALYSTIQFGVAAVPGAGSGAPTYTWRKGGVPITGNPSALTAVLQLSDIQPSDVGTYDCLVTNSCGGTGTLSSSATLTLANVPACKVADIASLGGTLVPDGQKTADDIIAFLASFFSQCP